MSVHLRGVTWAHTRGFAPLAMLGRVWEDFHPGEKITWEDRSLRSFGEEPLDRFADDYDLIVYDYPFAGEALEQGWVQPLGDLLPAEVIAARRAGAIGPGFDAFLHQGRLAGILIDMATHVSVHRSDLLRRLGAEAPQDWPSVIDLARRTGAVAMPMRPTGVWGALLSICAIRGQPAFAELGPGVPTEIAAEALAQLRDLAALAPDCCFSAYPTELLNRMAMADDLAYMPFTYGYATYGIAGYGKHRLRYGALPVSSAGQGGAIMGGAGIGITRGCRDTGLAARHIAWLSSPEVQSTLYVFAGGQPAQRAAWEDPTADSHVNGFFSATREAAERAYLRPNRPGFHAFQNAAAQIVFACVARQVAIADSLSEIARLWRGLIGEEL